MHLSSPLEALASSLYHAANIALPIQCYQTRDFEALHAMSPAKRDAVAATGNYPMRDVSHRPDASQCTVIAMFAQLWGSTALGFGGVGGAAMTPAYTVAIQGPDRTVAVYWDGRLAYLIREAAATPEQRAAWKADLAECTTVARRNAVVRYGAKLAEVA